MSKRYITLLSVLVLALIIFSQRGALMLRVLPAALDNSLSANLVDNLEDGLHVSLCGAGGPMPSTNRSGACVAVVAGKQLFVVDAGTNGARNLGRMGFNQGQIEALLLTHFHSDHIDGLGEMAMLRWVTSNNNSPLPVYGPVGVTEVVAGFNRAYSRDAVHRNDHHGDAVAPLTGTGMTAVSFELPQNGTALTVYQQGPIKIEMISVDHSPVAPAVAYKFSYKDRSALISGDTVKSAVIEKHATGIDLLVHEALSAKLVNLMADAAGRANNPLREKIFHDILDYHATPVEAAETARDAAVGHLLYYHIVPPLIAPGMEAIWNEGVDDVFENFTVGEDGSSISLPANSSEIIIRPRLL